MELNTHGLKGFEMPDNLQFACLLPCQESEGKQESHLVAMGTNWNPSNQPQQRSNGINGSRPSFSSPAQMSQSSSTTLTQAAGGSKKVGKTSTMPHISGSRPNMRDGELIKFVFVTSRSY